MGVGPLSFPDGPPELVEVQNLRLGIFIYLEKRLNSECCLFGWRQES
jgi:hypothetical protein